MKQAFLFLCVLCLSAAISNGQTVTPKVDQRQLIQFSGVVLDQDSLTPIPFVSIVVKGTQRGAVSDLYGFFNMIIRPGDELEFYAITHKNRSYKVPDTLKQKYYYAIQVLDKDTINLPPIEVYPWPTKEDFRRAFLALDLNETDAERADKNLLRDEMSYLERTQPASASESYKIAMQAYYTKVYTSGQQPVNNLLNPIKWAEFVNAWRSGKFSTKGKKK